VIIGRNEGERLLRCLDSVVPVVDRAVYVDSGSTDGSLAAARAAGCDVVELDVTQPFTAARARNAGLEQLRAGGRLDFVQFIDGDCELQPDWIAKATAFLAAHPQVAVVCGRRRERFPQATRWNRLIDIEWDSPVGKTRNCGGDSLMRAGPLIAAGGFREDFIAGEEPELCYRIRQAGWEVWRIDAEMTLHDAAMTRFSQWWKRSTRAGHTYAEGAALYGSGPERYNVARERSSLFWGAGVPLAALFGALMTPWALLILLMWPLQVVRLRLKGEGWERAAFMTLGKVAEAQGAIGYRLAKVRGRKVGLIEYK
jgi:glycosyltransferase involved in cell wall biosynthesis